MKPKHLLVALGLIAAGDPVIADPQPAAINVLPPGQYHESEVPHPDGSSWLALIVENDQSRLEPVRLRITQVYDPIVDNDEKGPHTGKIVTTEPALNAMLLVQGAVLREGAVKSAAVAGSKTGLAEKTISFESSAYTLSVSSGCGQEKSPCQWILSQGGKTQMLHEIYVTNAEDNALDTDSPNTGIVWAGDLDGDQRLDLILDVSNHYNSVADLKVFLSSQAKQDQLVGEAGTFHAVGC